ncbi:hypothetical protein PMZ80_002644 [Knufia obscura]|uniref:Serine hydrolase domain-containing protein n=2 Tax=Knufia TaxID=430999 RepID=A0AAN8I2K3_9EURO|nr:hypothetical protein PMZ80_002644 [Knufia obscura]KAK5951422.1 hypothetical protein OHC33_007478 [Knufia fluminis]
MSAPTKSQLLGTTPSASNQPSPSISRAATPTNTSSGPTHDSAGNLLPAILCLHGGGSNATVFKIQSRRLIWALQSQFRFVFAQAPLEGTPGFGMLPVFASCAPFYRWVERRFKIGESEVEQTPVEEVEALDGILMRVMEENGGVGSFAGVMGFSQGARLVPGLLLRQLIEQKTKLGGSQWKLKFGVMVGGPYPPIAVHEGVKKEDYELLRGIPTVHAWGRDDHVKSGCEVLWEACGGREGDVCFQMEFEGGHHMPLKDGEARDLCDLVMAAWFAGGGTRAVGAEGETY